MYEQIYALAGPDPDVPGDRRPAHPARYRQTIGLFERFFRDPGQGWLLLPSRPGLPRPRARVARAQPRQEELELRRRPRAGVPDQPAPGHGRGPRADFLAATGDTIVTRFPDYDNSPFVQERFHEDWSHDRTYKWQQDSAVVGHNLKIAWNLMRINIVVPKPAYVEPAPRSPRSCRPSEATSSAAAGTTSSSAPGPGRGLPPLRVARPQGMVAAGAGHPRLPDPARHARRRRVLPPGPRGGVVLQRHVPRP